MAVRSGDADLHLTAATTHYGITEYRASQCAHALRGAVLCGGQLRYLKKQLAQMDAENK